MPKATDKAKGCDCLLYSYMTTCYYLCCGINSNSSRHKEGQEAEVKLCS